VLIIFIYFITKSHNQFLNFIHRKNTDLKTIRTLSKIDEKYAQAASIYLKDERNYKKTIFKRNKYGDVNNQIPGDLKFVNTFDIDNKVMTEEPFYFEIDGIEIFGIPCLFMVNVFFKYFSKKYFFLVFEWQY